MAGNDAAAGAGHGLLGRARHLPPRPLRRPDRGHRGLHRATAAAVSTGPRATWRIVSSGTMGGGRQAWCPRCDEVRAARPGAACTVCGRQLLAVPPARPGQPLPGRGQRVARRLRAMAPAAAAAGVALLVLAVVASAFAAGRLSRTTLVGPGGGDGHHRARLPRRGAGDGPPRVRLGGPRQRAHRRAAQPHRRHRLHPAGAARRRGPAGPRDQRPGGPPDPRRRRQGPAAGRRAGQDRHRRQPAVPRRRHRHRGRARTAARPPGGGRRRAARADRGQGDPGADRRHPGRPGAPPPGGRQLRRHRLAGQAPGLPRLPAPGGLRGLHRRPGGRLRPTATAG